MKLNKKNKQALNYLAQKKSIHRDICPINGNMMNFFHSHSLVNVVEDYYQITEKGLIISEKIKKEENITEILKDSIKNYDGDNIDKYVEKLLNDTNSILPDFSWLYRVGKKLDNKSGFLMCLNLLEKLGYISLHTKHYPLTKNDVKEYKGAIRK